MTQKPKWREVGRGRKALGILVLGAALVAFALSGPGFGNDRGRPQHGRHAFTTDASPAELADRIDRLLDHLEMTDAQRSRITALVDELAPELADLAAQRDVLRDRIVTALAAEELTTTSIATLQQEVREQSAQLAERAIEIMFEVASELTPEQRTELVERWDRR